jgi:hypothetical protein
VEVSKPSIDYTKRTVDFGRGFYVTSVKIQAERWAWGKAKRHGGFRVVNTYDLNLSELNVKRFNGVSEAWVDFVILNRTNRNAISKYDVIIGEVADDQVYDAIQLYLVGIFDKHRLIQELRMKGKNNQLCLKTNRAMQRLRYRGYELV